MSVQDKVLWKKWAENLRGEMMTGLTPELTKTVESVAKETGTVKAESTLHSVRFWKAVQNGKSPNDALSSAGFDVDFEPEEDKKVREVTFKLNSTWMSILQGVLDRKKA